MLLLLQPFSIQITSNFKHNKILPESAHAKRCIRDEMQLSAGARKTISSLHALSIRMLTHLESWNAQDFKLPRSCYPTTHAPPPLHFHIAE